MHRGFCKQYCISTYISHGNEQFQLADTHLAVKVAPGRILVDFFPALVRTAFFAPSESTLSKADEDAATVGKLDVKGTSRSEVGHSVVDTAAVETGTGTSREVGIGAAESAAVKGAGGVRREGVVDADSEVFTKTTGLVGRVIVRGG